VTVKKRIRHHQVDEARIVLPGYAGVVETARHHGEPCDRFARCCLKVRQASARPSMVASRQFRVVSGGTRFRCSSQGYDDHGRAAAPATVTIHRQRRHLATEAPSGLLPSQDTRGRHQDATLDENTARATAIADRGAVKVDATTTLKLSGVHLNGGAIEISAPSKFSATARFVGDILTNTNRPLDRATPGSGYWMARRSWRTIQRTRTVKVPTAGNTLKLNARQ